MKYISMGFEPRSEWERLPRAEHERRLAHHQAALREFIATRAAVRRDGAERLVAEGGRLLLTSVDLGPPSEAATLRIRDGKPLSAEGSFFETNEVLAGFDLVELDSREEALEFARRCHVHDGHVSEIRRVDEMWWSHHSPGETDAMKFMLMFVDDGRPQSPAEIDASIGRHEQVGWDYVTQKALIRGAALAFTGVRLRPTAEATTLRMRPDKLVVTDGPFAETREVLGGFCILDCASKAEAIEWAKQYAGREGEAIEIRPVRSMWWFYHG
jgi:hypothetical protein